MISSGVTHTGQPGPCTSVMEGGNSSSMPYLTMVCVCPPQISISVHGLVVTAAIACRSFLTATGSRYSSRYFMENEILRQILQFLHLFEQRENVFGFLCINAGNREADVYQGVIV